MKGRIIGLPSVVMIGEKWDGVMINVKARLAVAVELDTHLCVAALLPEDVFPVVGAEVNVKEEKFSGTPFNFFIMKEWKDTGSLPYIDRPDPIHEPVTGYNDPTKWSDMLKKFDK